MKKLFSVLVIGGLLTLLIAATAQAQLPGTEIRVSIPFDFVVRGKSLPAGEYEVTRITDEPAGLLLRNVNDKRDHVVFETEPVDVHRIARRSMLIFNRYGDSYFLSEVVTGGEQTGRELRPSHEERQLRREMARNQVEPETIMVASN